MKTRPHYDPNPRSLSAILDEFIAGKSTRRQAREALGVNNATLDSLAADRRARRQREAAHAG